MSTLGEQWMQEGMQKGLSQGFLLGFLKGLEQGFQQGFQQGFEQGRKEAIENITLRLLRRRFTDLDQRIQARIRELSFEELERLTDALLDFNSAEELTTWLAAHSRR